MVTDPDLTTPCASCPFRLTNQGKRIPQGVYTEANLRRLWEGLAHGRRLACLERSLAPDGVSLEPARECGGSLQLVARHLRTLRGYSFETYQALAQTPLSRESTARWITRLAEQNLVELFLDAVDLGVPWHCPVTNNEVTS